MNKNKYWLVETKQPNFFITLRELGLKKEELIGWEFINPKIEPEVYMYVTYNENNMPEVSMNSHGGNYKNSQFMGKFKTIKELRKEKLEKLNGNKNRR